MRSSKMNPWPILITINLSNIEFSCKGFPTFIQPPCCYLKGDYDCFQKAGPEPNTCNVYFLSWMRQDPSDCDFYSIALAMLPTSLLLWSTFPTFRFALLSSYTSSKLLSGALCFKLIYIYGYLSWIFVLSSLFI